MNKQENTYDNYLCAVCDYEELSRIRNFVQMKALDCGFSDADSQKIALAVDEACSNLIRHAFKFDPNKKICIEIEIDNNKFVVMILDDGTPFNPLDVNSPDMKEYFDQFKRGGLGIHIMKSVMDDISYIPSDKHKKRNILKLIKKVS